MLRFELVAIAFDFRCVRLPSVLRYELSPSVWSTIKQRALLEHALDIDELGVVPFSVDFDCHASIRVIIICIAHLALADDILRGDLWKGGCSTVKLAKLVNAGVLGQTSKM